MNLRWSSAVGITDERLTNIERYKNLASAVIVLAARDYTDALTKKDEAEQRRLERFFRSEHFSILCSNDIDPEYLIIHLKQMARHKRKVKIWT